MPNVELEKNNIYSASQKKLIIVLLKKFIVELSLAADLLKKITHKYEED